MSRHPKTALTVGLALALAACQNASVFEEGEPFSEIPDDAKSALKGEIQSFARLPASRSRTMEGDVLISERRRGDIPAAVAARELSYSGLVGFTLGDFAELTHQADLPGIAFPTPMQPSDEESSTLDPADLPLPLASYDGCLGGFLHAVERVHDMSFDYDRGTLFATRATDYTVSMPQDSALLEKIGNHLSALGAREVAISQEAAQVSYQATPSVHRGRIVPYLDRVRQNLAMVTVQAAFVSVNVTDTKQRGIDWGNTEISFAEQRNLATEIPDSPYDNDGSGGSGGSDDDVDNIPALLEAGPGALAELGLAGLSGNAVGAVGNNLVGIASAFLWLENLGKTRTSQSVELSTLAGSEVSFRSGTTEPFVSEVGVGNVSGEGSSGNVGTVETETVESGLNLNVATNYDASSKLVTLDLDLNLNVVEEFRQLSAGQQFGTISQPVTRDREFEDKLRVKTGETTVVGGLRDVSMQRNSDGPWFTSGPLRSQKRDFTEDALFLVVRPVVTEYRIKAEKDPASPDGHALGTCPDPGAEKNGDD